MSDNISLATCDANPDCVVEIENCVKDTLLTDTTTTTLLPTTVSLIVDDSANVGNVELACEYTQYDIEAISKYRDAINSRKLGQKTLFPITTVSKSNAIDYFTGVTNGFIHMDPVFVNVLIANTMSCNKIFVGHVNVPPIHDILQKTIGLYGKNLKQITYNEGVLFIWYNKLEFHFTVWSTSYKSCVSALHTLNRRIYNNFIKHENTRL